MMLLKSLCLVYIIVFASLGIANATGEFNVTDVKDGDSENVTITKDGKKLTTQITNNKENYTVIVTDEFCIVKYGDDIPECSDTEKLDVVSDEIRSECGDKDVFKYTEECNEHTRRKRALRRCFYYYFIVYTQCSGRTGCYRCTRRYRVYLCYPVLGK